MTGRDRLLAALAPELVEAIEQLVEERIREQLVSTNVETISPWLGLDEAAGYLRVSPRTLERAIAKGRIRSTTIGRRRLLSRPDLDDYAGNGGGEAPATPPRHPRRGV